MTHATSMFPTITIAERAMREKRVVLIVIMHCVSRIKILKCRLMVREVEGSGE